MALHNTTTDGFLLEMHTWTKEVALMIAQTENLELTPEHWEMIKVIRDFYQEYKLHPGMRVLIKLLQQKLSHENHKIDSIYVHLKFPQGIKQLSKISGLPKPINCI